MLTRDALIGALADGRIHSGSSLALALGLSRSAVWKQVHRLGEIGLEIDVVPGRGYRLREPLDLLDQASIQAAVGVMAMAGCESLEVAGITESTSAALIAASSPAVGRWRALLAEYQSAGRGRRGRRWVSPYASGLCLSLAWSFATAPRDLPALSLAVGVAVRRTLAACGAGAVQLKWPNDVVLGGAKLGGILVDVDGDARGPLRAVVGLGLNLTVPDSLRQAVLAEAGLPPGGLDAAVLAQAGGRNGLAAALLAAIHDLLAAFARHGFAPLADEWRRHDHLCGQTVTVRSGATEATGVARGIAADGALLVEGPAGIAAVFAGDVTLRNEP